MKILITGGLGVNGSWVTRGAVARGHDVTVIDIREDFSLFSRDERDGFEFATLDARDQDAVRDLAKARGIEVVIHMAAVVGHGAIDPDPYRTYDLNAGMTVNLLEASRRAGIRRFIFTSSRAVYGDISGEYQHPQYRMVPETYPLRPAKLYDVCKVAGEGVGRVFADSFGMEFASLRFAMIYGPGKTQRHGAFGTVTGIIEAGRNGTPISIASGGEQKDDMIFAEDAAEGVLLAMEASKLQHTEYNICNGVGFTLRDVAQAVRHYHPEARIEIGSGINFLGFALNYSGILDPSRAIADLGWTPRTDLTEAIGRYYKTQRDR